MAKRDFYITFTTNEPKKWVVTAENTVEAITKLQDMHLTSTVTIIEIEESEDE